MADDVENTLPTNQIDERQTLEELTQLGRETTDPSMPDESGRVLGYWMVLAYLLHTTGELCLSPVGLSAVTKLAVPSVVGVMMGAWFLATAYSEFVAVQLKTRSWTPSPAPVCLSTGRVFPSSRSMSAGR